jgi:hypothetical protein
MLLCGNIFWDKKKQYSHVGASELGLFYFPKLSIMSRFLKGTKKGVADPPAWTDPKVALGEKFSRAPIWRFEEQRTDDPMSPNPQIDDFITTVAKDYWSRKMG